MNGLVPALIKNLAKYVTRHGRTHDKMTILPDSAGNVSPSGSGMSPQSRVGGLSPSPWSPYSSPPASPASIYSPLCLSEDELEATPVLLDEDLNIEVKVTYCFGSQLINFTATSDSSCEVNTKLKKSKLRRLTPELEK